MTITPCRPKWKGTMTDRERFRRQMHWQPVDRSFNMEFGYWNENFTEWDIFAKNGITSNAEADIFFNFDRIAIVSGNVWMSPSFPPQVIKTAATLSSGLTAMDSGWKRRKTAIRLYRSTTAPASSLQTIGNAKKNCASNAALTPAKSMSPPSAKPIRRNGTSRSASTAAP